MKKEKESFFANNSKDKTLLSKLAKLRNNLVNQIPVVIDKKTTVFVTLLDDETIEEAKKRTIKKYKDYNNIKHIIQLEIDNSKLEMNE